MEKQNSRHMAAAVAQWIGEFAPQAEGWVFESQLRQIQVVKQVVTAPLPNARKWVLGDDHYRWMPRVSVGVAC